MRQAPPSLPLRRGRPDWIPARPWRTCPPPVSLRPPRAAPLGARPDIFFPPRCAALSAGARAPQERTVQEAVPPARRPRRALRATAAAPQFPPPPSAAFLQWRAAPPLWRLLPFRWPPAPHPPRWPPRRTR